MLPTSLFVEGELEKVGCVFGNFHNTCFDSTSRIEMCLTVYLPYLQGKLLSAIFFFFMKEHLILVALGDLVLPVIFLILKV